MRELNADFLTEVAQYYTSKLAEYGETPNGVDWNGARGQCIRFDQLSKIIRENRTFSLSDVGCGYGALYEYLADRYASCNYHGYDISEEMILAAKKRFAAKENAKFVIASEPEMRTDYIVASGIFNVRLGRTDKAWRLYIEDTLDMFDSNSLKGFAFNCLTSYSDVDKLRDYLYYADPCSLFDLCKKKYSRNVALLHDYDLYEFTLLVVKEG